jgi:transcriptional regulator with XRE-family HTH domain
MWAPFLTELLDTYGGTQQDFATAIGKSRATVSHWLSRETARRPGVEVCLRIAGVTETSASRVLRAAGHAAVADLLETLYGPAVPSAALRARTAVSPADVRVLAQLHALDPKTVRAVRHLLQRLSVPTE